MTYFYKLRVVFDIYLRSSRCQCLITHFHYSIFLLSSFLVINIYLSPTIIQVIPKPSNRARKKEQKLYSNNEQYDVRIHNSHDIPYSTDVHTF